MTAIRELSDHADLRETVALQKTIWGFDDADLLPFRMLVVATKIGGQLLGAFDGERLIAFCLCIPGLKPDGKIYLHSHMLGVLPEYRNAGLGRQLKLRQKQDALARGIDLIEWTFDPLELKNAYFNIERLGAVVRHYVRNQYGISSSLLHGGIPTDRCVAEWWIKQPRPQTTPIERIEVPADIHSARTQQARIADDFERSFASGLAVVGMEGNTYLLGRLP
ncbi:MAG TPA: GNAT family N-acetyltransferase [Bryobacteraceae bacterium]|nr:GNAT family N-acetyltransferase [Bryobacteraceae bacterium]